MSFSTSLRIERLIRHVLVASFRCSSRVLLLSEQGRSVKTKSTGVKRAFSKRAGISLGEASSSRPSSCRRERPSLRSLTPTDGRSFSAPLLVCDSADGDVLCGCLIWDGAGFVARCCADVFLSESADRSGVEVSPENQAIKASSAVAAGRARRSLNVGQANSLAFAPNIKHENNRPKKRRRIFVRRPNGNFQWRLQAMRLL